MTTRKSMKLPIVITFIVVCIIVYLFTNIKQTVVVCEKVNTYDSDVTLKETVTAHLDGKKITALYITKKITLPDKWNQKEQNLLEIKNSLAYTVDYLEDHASCTIIGNHVVNTIDVSNDEIVLLDNIDLVDQDGEIVIDIDTNTKSSDVIALQVGDNYTAGEFMKYLKNKGYACK